MEIGNATDCVRVSEKLPRITRRIALAAAGVAFILGLGGFAGWWEACSCQTKDQLPFFSALLQTFQLYVLNVGPDAQCNSFTWVAAFLAPLATISALLTVFSGTVGTAWQRFRLSRKEPDVVFLGGGKSATAIALRKYPKPGSGESHKRDNIVFVDNSQAPLIHEHISRLGCSVCDWHGNALSGDVLKSTNTVKARQVWVLTGDDRRNIEIAQNLANARGISKNKSGDDQHVMVNVYDQELIRDVSFAIEELANIRFFSMARLAARHLLLQHSPLLPERGLKDGAQKCTPLHIAVVGEGDLMPAIVEQAIVHLVYSDNPQDCIHITLIGNDASDQVNKLNQRLPVEADFQNDEAMSKLLPIAQLQGIDCVPSHIKLTDWQACQVDNPFASVYVTAEVDLNTINWALRVASLRELEGNLQQKIVACLSQASHEEAAVGIRANKKLPENFVQFRTYDCISPDDDYPGEAQDNDARLVNLAYDVFDVKTFAKMLLNAAQIRAEEIWSGSSLDQPLEEMFRKSSRFAADHIYIKLVYLYPEYAHKDKELLYKHALKEIDSAPWSTAEGKPLDERLVQLMKLEHRRFVVERLVDGWLPTDKIVGDSAEVKSETKRKKELRLNDTLVPYDALPPEQELKDRLIVECIPKILELSGQTTKSDMHH